MTRLDVTKLLHIGEWIGIGILALCFLVGLVCFIGRFIEEGGRYDGPRGRRDDRDDDLPPPPPLGGVA